MDQPLGYSDKTPRVCRLNKSVYGTRQAPRQFNKKIKSVFLGLGLKQAFSEPCVYYSTGDDRILISLYVDDAIICAKSVEIIERFLTDLQKHLPITYRPLDHFLGLQISRLEDGSVVIHQEKYTLDVLERFNMLKCKPCSTPADRDIYSEDTTEEIPDGPYRSLLGSINYLSVCSRPDLSFIVGFLSRFLEHPTKKRWSEGMRVLRYLRQTSNYGLIYKSTKCKDIVYYSDADYASCPVTRKSVSGSLVECDSGPLAWGSQHQRVISLSSSESELIAAVSTIQLALYFSQLCKELGHGHIPSIKIDNQATISIVSQTASRENSKHISARYLYVRDLVENGTIEVEFVGTEYQLSDMLTKATTKATFQKLRSLIGISAY